MASAKSQLACVDREAEQLRRLIFPEGDCSAGCSLVQQLLRWHPGRRPTCSTALQHTFLIGASTPGASMSGGQVDAGASTPGGHVDGAPGSANQASLQSTPLSGHFGLSRVFITSTPEKIPEKASDHAFAADIVGQRGTSIRKQRPGEHARVSLWLPTQPIAWFASAY